MSFMQCIQSCMSTWSCFRSAPIGGKRPAPESSAEAAWLSPVPVVKLPTRPTPKRNTKLLESFPKGQPSKPTWEKTTVTQQPEPADRPPHKAVIPGPRPPDHPPPKATGSSSTDENLFVPRHGILPKQRPVDSRQPKAKDAVRRIPPTPPPWVGPPPEPWWPPPPPPPVRPWTENRHEGRVCLTWY